MLEIKLASTIDFKEEDYRRLFDIVTKAYAETEEEVWGKNYVRIPYKDYVPLLKKGEEMLVAYLEGELVGSVRFYERRSAVYTFSLLSADFSQSGNGIGRALIEAVEAAAKAADAKMIEIEILRIRDFDTTFKKWLADWYVRLGYQYTESKDFAKLFPEKGAGLAAASDFDYYQKLIKS